VRFFHPGDFYWHPVTFEQVVSDDPDLQGVLSVVSYDHTNGRLGSDLTMSVYGSTDDTDNRVLVYEEVWIEIHLPTWFAGDLPVEADFETIDVDQRFEQIEDEAGFSDLSISWKSQPYATSGFPKGSRVYDRVLAEGTHQWDKGPYQSTPTAPGGIETRRFWLKDL
jgi:hypothetical protein